MGGYLSKSSVPSIVKIDIQPSPLPAVEERKKPSVDEDLFEIYHHAVEYSKETKSACTIVAATQANIIDKLVPGSSQYGEYFVWKPLEIQQTGDYAGSHFLNRADGIYTSFLFVNKTKDTVKVKLCLDRGDTENEDKRFQLLNHYECPPGPSIHELCDNSYNTGLMAFHATVLRVPGYVCGTDYTIQIRTGGIVKNGPFKKTTSYITFISNTGKAFICEEGVIKKELEMKDDLFDIYRLSTTSIPDIESMCGMTSLTQKNIIKTLTPGSDQFGEYFVWKRHHGESKHDHYLRRTDTTYTSFFFDNDTKDTIKVNLCVDRGYFENDSKTVQNRFQLLNSYECPPGPSVHELCDNFFNLDAIAFFGVVLQVPEYLRESDYTIQFRKGSIWGGSRIDKSSSYILFSSNINKVFVCNEGMVKTELDLYPEKKVEEKQAEEPQQAEEKQAEEPVVTELEMKDDSK
jgi:hypothetical protein